MELTLVRRWLTSLSTIGELSVDGEFECFTLELPQGRCIPPGRYRVTWGRSPRLSALYGRDFFTPRLHDVPDFEGVLIHVGNTASDTDGCILPGTQRAPDQVLNSRSACALLYPKVQSCIDPVFITVTAEPS